MPTNLHPVIPTKVGIQFFEFQSFPINCLSIECLDSRLRGNDGRAVSVFSDKFLKLKISSFLQKQKTKIRNLKFVIPAQAGIQFLEFQSFPINCLSIECLDSRLRGNDGIGLTVFN
ncbi:pilS cassette [Neisseria meningitidis]|nr:pilS cassette [Neisseria meningitidis]RQK75444.1 pilS cassette [Neisseria meningitidis]